MVDAQESVADCPAGISEGAADMLTCGNGRTVTVAVAMAVPPEPAAVIVYVVVVAGVTEREPDTETLPSPWSMKHVVLLADVHESVADWPAGIEEGAAVKLTVA